MVTAAVEEALHTETIAAEKLGEPGNHRRKGNVSLGDDRCKRTMKAYVVRELWSRFVASESSHEPTRVDPPKRRGSRGKRTVSEERAAEKLDVDATSDYKKAGRVDLLSFQLPRFERFIRFFFRPLLLFSPFSGFSHCSPAALDLRKTSYVDPLIPFPPRMNLCSFFFFVNC